MRKADSATSRAVPAGYAELTERLQVAALPNWHESVVGGVSARQRTGSDGNVRETFPQSYWPGDGLTDHLEFAMKYDGTSLEILAAIFSLVDGDGPLRTEFVDYIKSRGSGKYARRLWFLYEFLTGVRLPIEDMGTGNYVNLLDPDRYYTREPGTREKRFRVSNNLLGNEAFCPLLRRTERLSEFEESELDELSEEVLGRYSPALLSRANAYLYLKETKSSFEIENSTPTAARTERFVALLQQADRRDFCTKDALIEVQREVVGTRFAAAEYRGDQNFVGESLSPMRELVHYVPPKPGDLSGLMDGIIEANSTMRESGVHPVLHAAAIGYGFVFIHPFDDGNGRIHRFLIHNILATRGYSPEGVIFPVSAAMLKHRADYDASLEEYSLPLMKLVDYTLNESGELKVKNDTARFYRYPDLTRQAEALFAFIRLVVTEELPAELEYLCVYDKARKEILEIVEMPDRLANMFISICLRNNMRLSKGKREKYFDMLTDDEIAQMEKVVRELADPRSQPD